jgi:hypothetical protein
MRNHMSFLFTGSGVPGMRAGNEEQEEEHWGELSHYDSFRERIHPETPDEARAVFTLDTCIFSSRQETFACNG